MSLLKVKPWGEDQGDHVLIDEESFDPDFHVLLDAKAPEAPKAKVKPEPTAKSAD